MKLIVGLGNPTPMYHNTRHNLGFMVIDALLKNLGLPPAKADEKFLASVWEVINEGDKTLLAKPSTYMNESGHSVAKLTSFYKLPLSQLIVIHDEIDLPFGQFKLDFGRSSAGHNGVQSVIDHLGTKDFTRLRLGVGNEHLRTPIDPSDFVLAKFDPSEQALLPAFIKQAIDTLMEA